jgi:hypothetical protein
MKGIESVVETWVSVLEQHSSKLRNLTQARLEHEAMVAINGPEVVHCDPVVKEALSKYWARSRSNGDTQGHWVRKSEHIKCYTVSKAVDSIVKKKPKVPLMAKK